MIGTIGHLGKVSPDNRLASAGLFTLGATVGAAILGFTLATLGLFGHWVFRFGTPRLDSTWVLMLIAAVSLAGGLRDFGVLRFRMPQQQQQLPKGWWFVFGP